LLLFWLLKNRYIIIEARRYIKKQPVTITQSHIVCQTRGYGFFFTVDGCQKYQEAMKEDFEP